jgi:hypothetical protein
MTRFQRPISASTKARQFVPRRFLPTHPAMFGNRLQMPVTRSGHILVPDAPAISHFALFCHVESPSERPRKAAVLVFT